MIEVIKFFRDNPNPSDEELHEWAEENNLSVDEVEEFAYALATSMVEFLHGGLAFEAGFTEDDADPDELEAGIEVEKEEHTNNEMLAKKIAMDHLAEIDDYYSRLDKMEKQALRDYEA